MVITASPLAYFIPARKHSATPNRREVVRIFMRESLPAFSISNRQDLSVEASLTNMNSKSDTKPSVARCKRKINSCRTSSSLRKEKTIETSGRAEGEGVDMVQGDAIRWRNVFKS